MNKQLRLIDLGKYDLVRLTERTKAHNERVVADRQQDLTLNTRELKKLAKIVKNSHPWIIY